MKILARVLNKLKIRLIYISKNEALGRLFSGLFLGTRTLKNRFYLIFLSLIIAIFFRGWFYPGIITHGDWKYVYIEAMRSWFSFPYAWQSQINPSPIRPFRLSNHPIRLLFGLLASFGFDFSVSERILYHFPIFFLSIFSMYYLTYTIYNNRIISFNSSLLYGLNSYVLILGDHLTIKMAYLLAPLILAFFIKSLNSKKLKDVIITGLLFFVCMAYEVRISYIILGILLFYSIYNVLFSKNILTELFRYIKVLSVLLITNLLLGSYWILPYFFTGVKTQMSSMLPATPWISWMTMLDAITLRHPFYTLDGKIEPFVVHEMNPIFFLIPAFSFLALFLKKKDKNVIFFALLSIIGIFLVKQENFPLGWIYTWLFKNFPGFNMFREASKFYLIIALGYSILFGVAIAEIHKKLRNITTIFKGQSHQFSISGKYTSTIFLFLILSAQLIMVWPIASGQQKTESYYPIKEIPYEYKEIEKFIKKQPPNEFRTLWLPYRSRFSFYSNEYIIMTPQASEFLKSLLIQHQQVTKFRTNNLGAILVNLNIKYVVVSPDLPLWEEKHGEHIYHGYGLRGIPIERYEKFLGDQQDLQRIELGQNIYVYENKKYKPSLVEMKPSNFSIEDLSSYKVENLILNSDFENQELEGWSINGVNVQNMSLSMDAYEGTFSLKTELYNSTRGWKSIKSPLIPAKDGDSFRWEFYVKGENSYDVHKKLVEYNENRTITKGHHFGTIGSGDFTWKRVSFEFTSLFSETAYIQLQVWYGHETTEPLPNRLWIDSVKVYVHSILDPDVIWSHSTQEENDFWKLINYRNINPTKYIVEVNASKPFMLSFAEAYDSSWVAYVEGEKINSAPLWITNSFLINHTGLLEITIEYEPQRWFYYGSIISIITLIGSLAYLIWDWKKRNYRELNTT